MSVLPPEHAARHTKTARSTDKELCFLMYLIINWVLCVVRAAVAKNSTRSVTYIMLVITRGIKFDNVQRRSWRMYQMVKVIMTFILLCLTVRHTPISIHLHRANGVSTQHKRRQAQPLQSAGKLLNRV